MYVYMFVVISSSLIFIWNPTARVDKPVKEHALFHSTAKVVAEVGLS